MKTLIISLVAIISLSFNAHAKGKMVNFYYQCEIANPAIYGEVDESKKSIDIQLTRQRPVRRLDGKLRRGGEEIDIQLELRGARLASNDESAPRVAIKLMDKTNDRELFSLRGVDAQYRLQNSFDDTPEENAKNDVSVNCNLKSQEPTTLNSDELARLIAIFFLGLKHGY